MIYTIIFCKNKNWVVLEGIFIDFPRIQDSWKPIMLKVDYGVPIFCNIRVLTLILSLTTRQVIENWWDPFLLRSNSHRWQELANRVNNKHLLTYWLVTNMDDSQFVQYLISNSACSAWDLFDTNNSQGRFPISWPVNIQQKMKVLM